MRYTTTLSLALLATTTSSVLANDIVSLFLPMLEEQPVEGKVVGTKGQMTSYVLYCPKDTPAESCALPQEGYTMAQGPSSYAMAYSYNDYHATQDCEFINSSVISCTVSMSDATTTQSTSAALTTDHMPFYPVTITATEGVTTKAKAAATKEAPTNTAATSTAATSTPVSSTPSVTPSGTASSSSATVQSTAAASTTSAAVSPSSSGNAAAAATGRWVAAGGAAMGVVLALV